MSSLSHLTDYNRDSNADAVLKAVEETVQRLEALKVKHSKAVQIALSAVGILVTDDDIINTEARALLPLSEPKSLLRS